MVNECVVTINSTIQHRAKSTASPEGRYLECFKTYGLKCSNLKVRKVVAKQNRLVSYPGHTSERVAWYTLFVHIHTNLSSMEKS